MGFCYYGGLLWHDVQYQPEKYLVKSQNSFKAWFLLNTIPKHPAPRWKNAVQKIKSGK